MVFIMCITLMAAGCSNTDNAAMAGGPETDQVTEEAMDSEAPDDTEETNIFLEYQKQYKKIEKETQEIADKKFVDVDKYLTIATLVAPLTNTKPTIVL